MAASGLSGGPPQDRQQEPAVQHRCPAQAINNGKMVEFLYRKADSREKEKRTVSPWQLAWENGCYYLIAFADEKGIRHYRWTR